MFDGLQTISLDEVESMDVSDRRTLLADELARFVRSRMRLEGELDTSQPLKELGLDSFGALQLRNTLQARIGRPLAATLIYNYPSIDEIAGYVAALVDRVPRSPISEPVSSPSALLARLRELPEDEARALMQRRGEGPSE